MYKYYFFGLILITGSILLYAMQTSKTPSTGNGPATDCQYTGVGAIPFSPAHDKAEFTVCDCSQIYQYYQVNTSYRHDRKWLKNYFITALQTNQVAKKQSGYIVIRFLVNCQGKTDRFRVSQMDMNAQPVQFEQKLTEQLVDLTKQLHEWIPGQINGTAYDSYYYLNFKIEKGNLQDINP